jgi:hypothetical protein
VDQGRENILALKRPSILKDYINGKFGILANVITRIDTAEVSFEAFFERNEFMSLSANNPRFGAKRAKTNTMCLYQWDDGLVLITNVQIMECPQGVIPSRVWLKRIDHINDLFSGLTYARFPDLFIEIGGDFGKWKINAVTTAPIRTCQIGSKDVKRASEIMNSIPKRSGNPVDELIYIFARDYFGEWNRKFRIVLRENFMGTRFIKPLKEFIDLRNVSFGPIEL